MRRNEINRWTSALKASLGGVRGQADRAELLALHERKDYAGMIRLVRAAMYLDMPLRIGYVNSGGRATAPAWVRLPVPMPMYGTAAFRATKITVYLRKSFLDEVPFSGIVCAMAHELSHVVLESMSHPLREYEEAVDLTAMILGFRDIFLEETVSQTVRILDTPPRNWFDKLTGNYPIPDVEIGYTEHRIGYLSKEEQHFAASLMQ